jgi:hypothetical protein
MTAKRLAARCIRVPSSCIALGIWGAICAAPWDINDDMPIRCSAISAAWSKAPNDKASWISVIATRWSRMLLSMCCCIMGGSMTNWRVPCSLAAEGPAHGAKARTKAAIIRCILELVSVVVGPGAQRPGPPGRRQGTPPAQIVIESLAVLPPVTLQGLMVTEGNTPPTCSPATHQGPAYGTTARWSSWTSSSPKRGPRQPGQRGDLIQAATGGLRMQDSVVSDNTGEGIRFQVGPATLISSTVSGNMTPWRARGIWAANAPLTLINSTVTGNRQASRAVASWPRETPRRACPLPSATALWSAIARRRMATARRSTARA